MLILSTQKYTTANELQTKKLLHVRKMKVVFLANPNTVFWPDSHIMSELEFRRPVMAFEVYAVT